jgi:hypothetical protein
VSLQIILACQVDANNMLPIGAQVIADPRSCLERLPEIKQAASDATSNLTVVVTNPAVVSMLDFLRDRPGVEFREVNPLADLTQRWGCPLPAQLTAEAVGVLRLLEMPSPPDGNALGTVLQRAYGDDIFLAATLTPSDEAKLLDLLVRGHEYAGITSTIENLLIRQLRTWGEHGSSIAAAVAGQPKAAPWYIILSVLRNYPPMIQQAVEDELVSTFGSRPPIRASILGLLPLEPKYISPIVRLPLERALRPHLFALPLVNYLSIVSGILPIELEILAKRVFDSPGAVSLFSMRKVFARLDGAQIATILELERHWQLLASLNFDVEETTRMKSSDKAFAELADFYVDHYLPMKDAYGTDPQGRERLLEWNENYAEWLIGHYHLLTSAHEPIFVADQLSYRLRNLLTSNKVPILWVIDGLAWSAFLRLSRMAERAGLFLVGEPKACLAPIPTITEIGMTTLISGETPRAIARQTPNRGNWRTAREEHFRRSYQGVKIGKANNPTQLYETLATPASIYLLQTLAVDTAVHNDDLDKELFDACLDVYFERLCRALAKAADYPHLHERIRDLVVIVATDHGYTDLLRPGVAQLPPGLKVETNLFSIDAPHHCVLEVTLPREATTDGSILRAELSKHWYVLEGDRFNLPAGLTWIVPRKQQRTRRGSLRVHGRPSLEETIVPLAEFSLHRQEDLKVQLAIRGRLIKDLECEVTLLVTNYETWPIKDATVEIPVLGINTHIAKVNPHSTEEVLVEAHPKQSSNLMARARIASSGGPFQWIELPTTIEQSDSERLLGEDRVANFFDEEEL